MPPINLEMVIVLKSNVKKVTQASKVSETCLFQNGAVLSIILLRSFALSNAEPCCTHHGLLLVQNHECIDYTWSEVPLALLAGSWRVCEKMPSPSYMEDVS